jgi:hypothetical protein
MANGNRDKLKRQEESKKEIFIKEAGYENDQLFSLLRPASIIMCRASCVVRRASLTIFQN